MIRLFVKSEDHRAKYEILGRKEKNARLGGKKREKKRKFGENIAFDNNKS